MNKAIFIARYVRAHGRATRGEICEAWRDECDRGRPMAVSTFYDNLHILEERFGICLENRGGHYVVRHADDGNPVLSEPGGPEGGGSRAERRMRAFAELIVEAMSMDRCVAVDYAPPLKEPYTMCFEPWALTRRRGLCYAVGRSRRHGGGPRTFALDRMTAVSLRPERFRRPADFSLGAYFAASHGAFGGTDLRPERVELTAGGRVAECLRTRPLHDSQREVAPGRFVLDVALTPDFVSTLLSLGAGLGVAAPERLRRLLEAELRAMLEAINN